MRGTTPRRDQGMADPVLALMVHAMGLEAACVAEEYEKVVHGANAVEEEAMRTYAKCREIATALAAHVRDLGYTVGLFYSRG